MRFRTPPRTLVDALWAGVRAEARQLARARLLVALVLVQAVTFLLLVSLFGLTGSMAPTALIDDDPGGADTQRFIEALQAAHHSFALRPMDEAAARSALDHGSIVAVITIPRGFSSTIARGGTVALPVAIDNVDADMTDDIERALPAAVVSFSHQLGLPGIRVHPEELDMIPYDTGYIPYLVVSGLALDAFVLAGILGASPVAREFESGTIRPLRLAFADPAVSIAGRILTGAAVSVVGMALTVAIVVLAYRVVPVDPLELAGALLLSIAVFSCVGAALGALVRRTLPLAALVFGLALPLYMDSGSLEPERFDGNVIWGIAHLSPVYYAVGPLENAFHGLSVTPEPMAVDALGLAGWAVVCGVTATLLIRRRVRA